VVASALVLSTLSFAAGVAGDLSLVSPPEHGTRIVVRIPPELPADTPRAAPMTPLLSTAAAEARQPRRAHRAPIVADTIDVELIEPSVEDLILATAMAAEGVHAETFGRQDGA
jgi:hypothetical protein